MSTEAAALRLLARRKFAGFLRRQWRRMRTLKGALLAIVGLCALAYWIVIVVVQGTSVHAAIEPRGFERGVAASLLMITILQLTNSLSFRGLYVHPGEIEALFSSPLSRRALIRHRLATTALRSLFGALFVGCFAAGRAPHWGFAFLAAMLAMLTVSVVGQALSLLTGDAENRIAARLSKLPLRSFSVVLALVLVFLVVRMMSHVPHGAGAPSDMGVLFDRLLGHPVVRALSVPFTPWTKAVAAPDARHFWPWFALCAALYVALFELTARIRVDYRELSLATSADVAKRLSRVRRGVGVAGVAPSKAARKWGVPWLAGRGPFGAVAWRKSVGIVRKSSTGVLLGAAVIAVITFFAARAWSGEANPVWMRGAMVAGIGTFYLCLGLRFDFREDLEVMSVIRAWPLAPWKVFLATIVPEVLLVSGLITLAVLGLALHAREFDALLALLLGVTPLIVAAWVAVDNAAHLFAPTRATPGQDGALQNAGRTMMMFFLRVIAAGLVIGGAAVPTIIAAWCELPVERIAAIGLAAGALLLALELVGLVWLGGEVLRRFDVARDRA